MVGGSKSKVAIAVGFVVVAVVAFIAGRVSPKVEIRHQDTLKPLADRTNAAPPPPENPGESPPVSVGWQVYEEKSAMDDTPTVTLSLMAKDSINTYRGVQTPSLQIRCREKSTDLYIINGASANPELGVEGATVRLRIDSAPAFSQVWDEGTDDTTLFATNAISLARIFHKRGRISSNQLIKLELRQ